MKIAVSGWNPLFPLFNPEAAHLTLQALESLPQASSQPLALSFNGCSPFFLFFCPFRVFSPFTYSLFLLTYTCFDLSVDFLWPLLVMTSSHLLTLFYFIVNPKPELRTIFRWLYFQNTLSPREHSQSNKQNKTFHQVTQKPASRLFNQPPPLMH